MMASAVMFAPRVPRVKFFFGVKFGGVQKFKNSAYKPMTDWEKIDLKMEGFAPNSWQIFHAYPRKNLVSYLKIIQKKKIRAGKKSICILDFQFT